MNGRRDVLRLGLAGAAAAGLGAGVAWWRTSPAPPLPGQAQAFGHMVFEGPRGRTWRMSDWRGQKVLVNFWATWCPPCVEELPMLDAFWQEHAAKNHQVLALALDKPESVQAFATRLKLKLPVAWAPSEGLALSKSLGNTAGALPFSVFFDADGSIFKSKTGQLTRNDLSAWGAAATPV